MSLLGMPADEDWVLIASYADESLLRNFVVYNTGRWLGRYASRTRLVEVSVNGSYEGVYLLGERLKLHRKRVALDETDVSGGYLLEMIEAVRAEGEDLFWTPITRQPVVYKDPNREDLSRKRASWIRRYVGRLERRLYGAEFADRERGYRPYLDVPAAIDFLLLNELFRNGDTFRVSTYMHKGVGGKLVLGPLWDFDHAIGNSHYDEYNPTTGWQYGAVPWGERLYADPAFRRKTAARWHELRSRGLLEHIMAVIDRGAGELAGGPAERNYSRWPVFNPNKTWPPDQRTGEQLQDHAQAIDHLKWWIGERVKWIDAYVAES